MAYTEIKKIGGLTINKMNEALAQAIAEGFQPISEFTVDASMRFSVAVGKGAKSAYTEIVIVNSLNSKELFTKVEEMSADGFESLASFNLENGQYFAVLTKGPSGAGGGGSVTPSTPAYYYVITTAGQSNGMAYGEGVPLPATLDKPDPRIKQLARRSEQFPGGPASTFNEIIPLDHCPHDVQNMSIFNNPGAVLPAEYGCVSQALHIAKKVLPFIPADAGILIVPCARGGSAFTAGNNGTYNAATGATEDSTKWGVGLPLYTDMVARTKAALDSNPRNIMMGVIWMQGEFDLSQATYGNQPGLFNAMKAQFATDMQSHLKQIPGFNASKLPWVCGGTTYWWKNQYPRQYAVVYGNYASREKDGIYFVPLTKDDAGNNLPTNLPAEDPNIPAAGYFGAENRTNQNWTASGRETHFSSFARRGPLSSRLAKKLLEVSELAQNGNVSNAVKSLKFQPELPAETTFALGSAVSFTVNPIGGVAPYTYAWMNGAGLVFDVNTATLSLTSNAGAALNNVEIIAIVTDANGDAVRTKTTLKQAA